MKESLPERRLSMPHTHSPSHPVRRLLTAGFC